MKRMSFTHLLALAALFALGLSSANAQLTIETFEFADTTTHAQQGVVVTPFGTNTAAVDSATGADATQGTYALRADLTFGTDAWNDIRISRTLGTTITLTTPLDAITLPGASVLVDLKGDTALGNKTLIVYLVDSDGERYRFISATDAAVKTTSYSTDYSIAFSDKDPWAGTTVDSTLTEIVGIEILLQDETTGTGESNESGTLYLDNLRLVEPAPPVSTYKTITIDGDISDWDGIPAAVTDASGDGGTGRDVAAIYLANDSDYLYVRIESHAADEFDGNELIGIDGDNSTSTGFSLFGLGLGSDTLVAGASLYGETTALFNAGGATPAAVTGWSASGDNLNIELSIDLTTTIPGDITSSFPGGLGSIIALAYGDSNAGATDTAGPVAYKLNEQPVPVELSSMSLE